MGHKIYYCLLLAIIFAVVIAQESITNEDDNDDNDGDDERTTPVFDSINQCCSLGSYRAKAQEEACDEIIVPVKDIIPALQATCISTMELCCTKTRRELQCQEGRLAALNGQECGVEDGEGRESFKDCCLSCTLGIVVASMGQKCSGVSHIFGCPLEQPFIECCEEIAAPLAIDFESNEDDDNAIESESSTDDEKTDDLCPEGFQYNSEMHVCDDIDEVRIDASSLLFFYKIYIVFR